MSQRNIDHERGAGRDDFERQLDLLVDGELADEPRRKLLESFDAQPEWWRRCALAFLESQCLASAARPINVR